jgi:hypothetical protein
LTPVDLIKNAILAAIAYRLAVKLWRKLRQPSAELSGLQLRLRPLWRLQAFGYALAGLGVLAGYTIVAFPTELNPPFWAVYVIVIVVGGGILVAVHAAELEKRAVAPAITGPPQPLTRSARYAIASKLTLAISFATFFAALSVSSLRRYAALEQPLLVVAYTLMGLALVFAGLGAWTPK